MLYYNLNNGECITEHITVLPKTCFIMTKLGDDIPDEINQIRIELEELLKQYEYKIYDAESFITGRDFLEKIWRMIIQIPVGICIVHKDMSVKTYANIFYELGLMQACGKETIVIKTKNAEIPSDFIRTEYISYGNKFSNNISKYMKNLITVSAHYEKMAEQLDRNPLLSIDYLRRAYLLSGDEDLLSKARDVVKKLDLSDRAMNSVEMLHAEFCQ